MKLAELNKGEDLDKKIYPIVLNLNTGRNYLTYEASKQMVNELEQSITKYEKTVQKYCEKYDSYYHQDTGEWLNAKCSSKNCIFCKDRPERIDLTNANTEKER